MVKTLDNRRINLITAFLICFAFITIFLLPGAFAADDNGGFINYMASCIVDGGTDSIRKIIKGEEFGTLYKDCTDGDMKDILGTIGGGAIANMIIAVGAAVSIIITFIHFIQNVERGQGDPTENVYKYLVEFFCTLVIVVNADKILGYAAKFGNYLVKAFAVNKINDGALTADKLIDIITNQKSGGIFWFIPCFVKLLIPWVLSLLVAIAVKFVMIQILLELAVRRAFSPIAVADIYAEGLRSPGARYIKKYFAAFLKIAIAAFVAMFMKVILAAISMDNTSGLAGAFNFIFSIIAVEFAGIGMILKGGEVANDIAGG